MYDSQIASPIPCVWALSHVWLFVIPSTVVKFFLPAFFFYLPQLVKNLPALRETWVWSLSWEDPPGEENSYPVQYSGLEKSMDSIVHGVAESGTWLSNFHLPVKESNPLIYYYRYFVPVTHLASLEWCVLALQMYFLFFLQMYFHVIKLISLLFHCIWILNSEEGFPHAPGMEEFSHIFF